MRKIIVGAQVSMDGIMQAPGAAQEDPTNGFKFGGWVMPYFDQEFGEEIDRVFKEKFDLLLGRKTYEHSLRMGARFDATKGRTIVFSRHASQADAPSGVEFVTGDIGAFVRGLRDQPGKDIWLMGGGELIASLLDEQAIDFVLRHRVSGR